jgi:cellobiose phosphorylase
MLGRGGWSWYTGSSSWLYIAGLQYVLGIKRRGEKLMIEPCFSKEWEAVFVEYKYGDAVYEINIYNPDKKENGFQKMYLNNELNENNQIKLKGEGRYKIDYIM